MRECVFCSRRTMQNHYLGEKSICPDCLVELSTLLESVSPEKTSVEGSVDGVRASGLNMSQESLLGFPSSAAPMSPEMSAKMTEAVSPNVRVVLPKSGSGAIPVPSGLGGSPVSQVSSGAGSAGNPAANSSSNPLAALGRPSGGATSAAARLVAAGGGSLNASNGGNPAGSLQAVPSSNPLAALGRSADGASSAAARLLASGRGAQGTSPGSSAANPPSAPSSNPLAALGRPAGGAGGSNVSSSSAAARMMAQQGISQPPQRPATGTAPAGVQRPQGERPPTGTAPAAVPRPQGERPPTGTAPAGVPRPQGERPPTGTAPAGSRSLAERPATGAVPASTSDGAQPQIQRRASGSLDLSKLLNPKD